MVDLIINFIFTIFVYGWAAIYLMAISKAHMSYKRVNQFCMFYTAFAYISLSVYTYISEASFANLFAAALWYFIWRFIAKAYMTRKGRILPDETAYQKTGKNKNSAAARNSRLLSRDAQIVLRLKIEQIERNGFSNGKTREEMDQEICVAFDEIKAADDFDKSRQPVFGGAKLRYPILIGLAFTLILSFAYSATPPIFAEKYVSFPGSNVVHEASCIKLKMANTEASVTHKSLQNAKIMRYIPCSTCMPSEYKDYCQQQRAK